MMMTMLMPQQFIIIPNGSVVRLERLGVQEGGADYYDGRYGTVVGWKERLDTWGNNVSYYEVRLSLAILLCVKMVGNVCL